MDGMGSRRVVALLLSCAVLAGACGGGSTVSGAVGDELTPASLPDGWGRCAGGPDGRVWTQTFGPTGNEDGCTPVVTMTQLPVGDSPPSPRGASWRDTRIGDYDATYLKDSENNTHMLFTWAFQQNLLFEARLDTLTKKELRQFASAAYEGLRQSTPLGCDDERSDLAPESLVAQLAQHDYRMFLDDGCPVRLEVAAIGAFPDDHHCWPGVENGRLGESHFWKDPAGELDRPQVTERFKDETELPAQAVDTGFHQGDRSLWIDPTDETTVYVVHPGHTEAWPVAVLDLGCA